MSPHLSLVFLNTTDRICTSYLFLSFVAYMLVGSLDQWLHQGLEAGVMVVVGCLVRM